jgi:hypothetical protein
MSKKKTNTAKSKAKRAARNLSNTFVKKLGASSASSPIAHGQRNGQNTVTIASTKPKTLRQSTTKQKKTPDPILGKKRSRNRPRWHCSSPLNINRSLQDEHSHFKREHDSLLERYGVTEMKRKQPSRAFTPAPASFGVTPTASQLLHTTTKQIQELEGIGKAVGHRDAALQSCRTDSEPSQVRTPCTVYWNSLGAKDQPKRTSDDNPWALLHDESVDYVPCAGQEPDKAPPSKPSQLFHFQPATFAVSSSIAAKSDPAWHVGADYDPDL